jgi:hypothetical protein
MKKTKEIVYGINPCALSLNCRRCPSLFPKLQKREYPKFIKDIKVTKKYELDEEDKVLINTIKEEWKKLITGKIYCDKRKSFYRIKLYMATMRDANKAKRIAKKYGVEATVENIRSNWNLYEPRYYNCIIKYTNM